MLLGQEEVVAERLDALCAHHLSAPPQQQQQQQR
jgi:hypothetical protein